MYYIKTEYKLYFVTKKKIKTIHKLYVETNYTL